MRITDITVQRRLRLDDFPPHERVIFAEDDSIGYRGVIAVHSTARGPAVGGTRFWGYHRDEDAIEDALRLSHGMTMKNAMAGLPFGGGKSVILRPPAPFDRSQLLRAHGRAVDSLGGRYITAEDVGTSPDDMAVIAEATEHVLGLTDGGGDPSPFTARGVTQALRAALCYRFGDSSPRHRRVAIQGLGNVGAVIASTLASDGAFVTGADVREERVSEIARPLGLRVVMASDVLECECDALMPCALGSVLHVGNVGRLRCTIVVGAANNQLADPMIAEELAHRDIIYVPDFVANAGGVMTGAAFVAGWSAQELRERVDGIYDTVLELLERSARLNKTPNAVAIEMARAAVGAHH